MKICDFCEHKDNEVIYPNEMKKEKGRTVTVKQLIVTVQVADFPGESNKFDSVVLRKDVCLECINKEVLPQILRFLELPQSDIKFD